MRSITESGCASRKMTGHVTLLNPTSFGHTHHLDTLLYLTHFSLISFDIWNVLSNIRLYEISGAFIA
jgi:hypothetical protein